MLDVEGLLQDKGVAYRLVPLGQQVAIAEEIHRLVGADPRSMCQTIVVRDSDRQLYACLIPGDAALDISKVKRLIGRHVAPATAEEVLRATGYPADVLCPLLVGFQLIVDQRIFTLSLLNIHSGDPAYSVQLPTASLAAAASFITADIAHQA